MKKDCEDLFDVIQSDKLEYYRLGEHRREVKVTRTRSLTIGSHSDIPLHSLLEDEVYL
jgi:hypothetical protein